MGRNVSDKIDKKEEKRGQNELMDILFSLKTKEELKMMLDDLLTEKEISDITQRYLLMDDLWRGESQRDIAHKRSMSLCKITRGSKMLKKKNGFMRKYFTEKYDDFTHI